MSACDRSGIFPLYTMVESSKVRQLYPSVSFLLARLGASFGSFSTQRPSIEDFVFRDSSLGIVLADLHPLLHNP